MATGNLSTSKQPRIAGQESFAGAVYHTADWPHGGVDFTGQRLLRGRLQCLGIGAGLSRVGRKRETVEAANHMALYDHFAGRG